MHLCVRAGPLRLNHLKWNLITLLEHIGVSNDVWATISSPRLPELRH